MTELIKPEQVTIDDMEGEKHTFIISRFPAIDAREIITQYPKSAVGDYQQNERVLLKMMKCVAAISVDGNEIILSSRDLINNHVPDGDTLLKLESKILEYNTNFFKKGGVLGVLGQFLARSRQSNTQTQINSSASSLATDKQAGTN